MSECDSAEYFQPPVAADRIPVPKQRIGTAGSDLIGRFPVLGHEPLGVS